MKRDKALKILNKLRKECLKHEYCDNCIFFIDRKCVLTLKPISYDFYTPWMKDDDMPDFIVEVHKK